MEQGALSHPCDLSLALQCDTVDTGPGGAAALPQPQAPEHREAAQVVPGMEGERQVSPSLLKMGRILEKNQATSSIQR